MEINQYAIVLVNLDPAAGSKIEKTRPCTILSPDEMNKNLKTVVVAPMTSNNKNTQHGFQFTIMELKAWLPLIKYALLRKAGL